MAELPRPSGAPDRATLPIAGDDESAKAGVTRLLDTLDHGTLACSWRSERGMPAYVVPHHEPAPEGARGRRHQPVPKAIPRPSAR